MANIVVKDSFGNNVYLKATGSGTDADPYIGQQSVNVVSTSLPLPTGASTEATVGSINTLTQTSLGRNGHAFITSTSPQAGSWAAIQVVQPVYFTSLTCAGTTSPAVNVALPAGFILYGHITAFTMSYGQVIAYIG